MQLAPHEDQEALVALVRNFLEKEVPPARVRASEPLGFDVALGRLSSTRRKSRRSAARQTPCHH